MALPKTGAAELVSSQASKEATANAAFRTIEVGAGLFRIEDNDATAPPGSCADGSCYIPAATATGAWAGKEKNIAIAVGVNASNGWYFIAPEEGMRAWVKDENAEFAYDGAAWASYAPTPAPGSITLNDLSDVDVPSPSDGQVLTYDTNSPTGWKAETPGSGVTTLDGLSDVDVPSPSAGQSLIYDTNSPTGWKAGNPTESFIVACSDETTAITAGTTKVTFRMPYAFTLTAVRGSLSTAQTSGGQVTVDVNEAGSTILSTKIVFDNGSKTSQGSSPQPVISDASLADDAEITVDIDNVGDGTAKGLKVTLIGRRT